MRRLSPTPNGLQNPNGLPKGGIIDLLVALIWLVWAISSLYLMAMSAYYAFLSIIFTGYSIRGPVRPSFMDYVVSTSTGSIPLLCSVVIALAGFFSWRVARFRILGLWIISIQVVLAIYLFKNPEGMLSFIDWLG